MEANGTFIHWFLERKAGYTRKITFSAKGHFTLNWFFCSKLMYLSRKFSSSMVWCSLGFSEDFPISYDKVLNNSWMAVSQNQTEVLVLVFFFVVIVWVSLGFFREAAVIWVYRKPFVRYIKQLHSKEERLTRIEEFVGKVFEHWPRKRCKTNPDGSGHLIGKEKKANRQAQPKVIALFGCASLELLKWPRLNFLQFLFHSMRPNPIWSCLSVVQSNRRILKVVNSNSIVEYRLRFFLDAMGMIAK